MNFDGVPLGGVGTGYVEINRRGRFQNFAINNNRTTDTILPSADGCFLGLRVAQGGVFAATMLQHETGLPIGEAGLPKICTSKRNLSWTPLYPSASFKLTGVPLPIEFSWRALSPIIPFDTEASMLPVFLIVMDFKNVSGKPCEVSGLFSWENLRGCTGQNPSGNRGTIQRADLENFERYSAIAEFHRGLKLEDGETFPLGLVYGREETATGNAEGNYALLCAPRPDTPISYATWNPYDPVELRRIWLGFQDTGALPNEVSPEPARCGAVCQSKTLAPDESFRFVFVCSWYCPDYEVNGENLGNAYTNEYTSAFDAALYTVEYQSYLIDAVQSWQDRLLDSSLPNWYSRMLINASAVLTTNSLHTATGEFSLFESPDKPLCSALDQHFYASLGTSVFFPNYAEREITMLAAVEEEGERGRLFRSLGYGTPREPGLALPGQSDSIEHIDLYAKYLLTLYRNFHMSGRLAPLRNNFATIQQVAHRALSLDRNDDGVPDGDGDCTVFAGWPIEGFECYTAGLWIAALYAYADMARRNGKAHEAARVEALARKTLKRFEDVLWDEGDGSYRNAEHADPAYRHLGQLAGPWMTSFMRLRPGGTKGWPKTLFDDARVTQAAHNLLKQNEGSSGYSLLSARDGAPIPPSAHAMPAPGPEGMYPSFANTLLACPLIYQDEAQEGLNVILKTYEQLKRKGRTLNHPDAWDAELGLSARGGLSRHVSALSVWYSYYALLGFFLSVPDKTLFIAPNLPPGVHSFHAPLFTPVSLGNLKWSEQREDYYQQRVTIDFDSPIQIARVELETPPLDCEFEVFIKCEGDVSRAEHAIFEGSRRHTVRIELNTNLLTQEPVSITLRELKKKTRPADKLD